MKKVLFASLALVGMSSLGHSFSYNHLNESYVWPYCALNYIGGGFDGTAVDDVTLSESTNITSVSVRDLLTTSTTNIVKGKLWIFQNTGLNHPGSSAFLGNGSYYDVTLDGSLQNDGDVYYGDFTISGLNINLGAGTYWFGLQVDQVPYYDDFGAHYDEVSTAGGPYDLGYGYHYTWDMSKGWTSVAGDLNMRVLGEAPPVGSTVPGPAAIVPFAIGLVGALRRRR